MTPIGSLYEAYAQKHGTTAAAARMAAMRNAPKWQKFLEDRKIERIEAVKIPKDPPPQTFEEEQAVEQVTASESPSPASAPTPPKPKQQEVTPELVAHNMAGIWRLAVKNYLSAQSNNEEPSLVASLGAAVEKARIGYVKARQDLQQWKMDQRLLIHIDEFHSLNNDFILPLRDALFKMPQECGPLANPLDHEAGRIGCREWLAQSLLPQIERLIVKMDDEYPVK